MYKDTQEVGSPTIGLDFDSTVTTNPQMWADIVKIFKTCGCKVYIVTYRDTVSWDNKDIYEFSGMCEIDQVIFTACKAKKPYCLNKGIIIDIWIDDNPLAIVASLTPEGFVLEK